MPRAPTLALLSILCLASAGAIVAAGVAWGVEDAVLVDGRPLALTALPGDDTRSTRLRVAANDSLDIAYRVTNDRPVALAERVRSFAGGDVVHEADIQLDPGESATIAFEVTPGDHLDGGNALVVDIRRGDATILIFLAVDSGGGGRG